MENLEEMEANARLIAAAPELVEACKMVHQHPGTDPSSFLPSLDALALLWGRIHRRILPNLFFQEQLYMKNQENLGALAKN